jgi:hypothetical protein
MSAFRGADIARTALECPLLLTRLRPVKPDQEFVSQICRAAGNQSLRSLTNPSAQLQLISDWLKGATPRDGRVAQSKRLVGERSCHASYSPL